MITPFTQRILLASANVRPARILALSNTVEETAAEATGATLPLVGVSVNAYKYANGGFEQQAIPFAAQTGDAIPHRGPGQVCQVLSGAAITNLARPLTSDANGRAISTAALGNTTNNWVVGYPLDTAAAADEIIRAWLVLSHPVLV